MPAGQRCFAGLPAASCGAGALTDSIERHWPSSDQAHRFVVITSGEPLLQLNAELIQALHACGFKIAVETNGTITPPEGIDWLCVDPKLGSQLVVHAGQELKLVYPQPMATPSNSLTWRLRTSICNPWTGHSRPPTPRQPLRIVALRGSAPD